MTFSRSSVSAEVPSHLGHLGRHITDGQACKIQNKNLTTAVKESQGWAVMETPYLVLSKKFLLLFHPLFLVWLVTIGYNWLKANLLQKLYIQDWLTEACTNHEASMVPAGCWSLIWMRQWKALLFYMASDRQILLNISQQPGGWSRGPDCLFPHSVAQPTSVSARFGVSESFWCLLSAKDRDRGGRALCFWSIGCCKSWGAVAMKPFTAPSLLSIEKSQYPSVCQMALNRCCYSRWVNTCVIFSNSKNWGQQGVCCFSQIQMGFSYKQVHTEYLYRRWHLTP